MATRGGGSEWGVTTRLLLLAGLLGALALVLTKANSVVGAWRAFQANLFPPIATVTPTPIWTPVTTATPVPTINLCVLNIFHVNRLDPSITHPELGRVDADAKVIQKVPMTAPGQIKNVTWGCEGEGCGWTWQTGVDYSGSTATWVGKTNSAAPGEYKFKVEYEVLGPCPQ